MNVKTKCEDCNKEITVWLKHYLLRKIFRIMELKLLCTKCYFKDAD